MVRYSAAFLVVALVAALFGFTDRSEVVAAHARNVCLIFAALWLVSLTGAPAARCGCAWLRKFCLNR